jgi:hypothetical protein
MATKRAKKEPSTEEIVEGLLQQDRVIYFPIKHFSPVSGLQVKRLIEAVRPVGVLVEGPEDATELIPWIVHEDTWAPLTIFSTYVDAKNVYGLNGILSSGEEVAARLRGWWPLTEWAPEYVGLKAGQAVGAQLRFIDVPLNGHIPHHHVPLRQSARLAQDHALSRGAYARALQKSQRRRSFEELWEAQFEVDLWGASVEEYRRRVMTFAWCARQLEASEEALEADGTLMREGHMRHHIEAFLKEVPEGPVVVIVGAFHAVALPETRKQKAKVKKDKNLETSLTSHSFRALANLYGDALLPVWHQRVWEALLAGSEAPHDAAALQLLIEVMRRARDAGEGVSTADSVGAYTVARNLGALRGNREVTLQDLYDAVRMGYVKGDVRVRGGEVLSAMREVLTGVKLGRVTSQAGQAPLVRDFYDQCRGHRLDLTGVKKIVRCDIHKQDKHQLKSAFLHQCNYLEVPVFEAIEEGYSSWRGAGEPGHYKGPDLATGENMHLITETWGLRWRGEVDERLLEVSDRGASVAQAAESLLRERLLAAKGDAADSTRLLLQSAQMMLVDVFDEVLSAVEDAIVLDASFEHLARALHDFVVLHSYRDAVSMQGHERVLDTIVTLFNKVCLILPSIANASGDDVTELMGHLQTLVRVTLTFQAVLLDRQLLIEKMQELVQAPDGAPTIRGAGYGFLFSFGATREKVVARELSAYLLGGPEQVLLAGRFLDGLFLSSKNIFMGSPRLLRAINEVLRDLDWETFKMILPDLRRAFTQFIPAEIDDISVRVSEEIGIDEAPAVDVPISEALARVSAAADARVGALLSRWLDGEEAR